MCTTERRSAREDARVRGEAGDGDAEVVVDADELLLVACEFTGRALCVCRSLMVSVTVAKRDGGGAHLEPEEEDVRV